jgi:hypothetical protein
MSGDRCYGPEFGILTRVDARTENRPEGPRVVFGHNNKVIGPAVKPEHEAIIGPWLALAIEWGHLKA